MAIVRKRYRWCQEDLDAFLREADWMLRQIGIPVADSVNPHVKVIADPTVFGVHQVRSEFSKGDDQSYEHQILLSAMTLENSKKSVMNTLLHELLHTVPDGSHKNGGVEWLRYADMVNRTYGYRLTVKNNRDMGRGDKCRYGLCIKKGFNKL